MRVRKEANFVFFFPAEDGIRDYDVTGVQTCALPISQIDLKTPTTLIEAAAGDSSLTTIDTLGNSYYIGTWPVDSMSMVSTIGLPNGFSLDCNAPNCVYEGDVVGCANVYGTTSDPVGIYPITILVNVYTHGSIGCFF